jgi:hypothetical protein
MGEKAEAQAKPKRLTQLGAAVRIGAFGGIWGAALNTFVYVTQLILRGEQQWGEATVLFWPLAIALALVGIPLGLVGRLISVRAQFEIDGPVRGAFFGEMIGLFWAVAIFMSARSLAGPKDDISELFLPLVGLLAGYIIAGALIGSKLKQELRSNTLTP